MRKESDSGDGDDDGGGNRDGVKSKKPGAIGIKALIRAMLASSDFEEVLEKLDIPLNRLIGPLLSFLYETNELIRWRAVRAIGIVVSQIARESPESARNVMRRLMWSLNDESGGIGWGAPEAMGEIMAADGDMARQYYCILLSYIDERGNQLENDQLERGVLWGIGRLAQARPELVRGCIEPVLNQLGSGDPEKRALAVWVLTILKPDPDQAREVLAPLLEDVSSARIFQDGGFITLRVADMAAEILAGAV